MVSNCCVLLFAFLKKRKNIQKKWVCGFIPFCVWLKSGRIVKFHIEIGKDVGDLTSEKVLSGFRKKYRCIYRCNCDNYKKGPNCNLSR